MAKAIISNQKPAIRKRAQSPDHALAKLYKPQDLDVLRSTYEIYRGEDMGANAVLNCCDEIELLRCALRVYGRHVFPCKFGLPVGGGFRPGGIGKVCKCGLLEFKKVA